MAKKAPQMNDEDTVQDIIFDPSKIYFIPLGGSEQFGVNLNVYAHQGQFLIVDMGIGFPDQRFPGVDLLLPDPSFLEPYKDDIAGLVITHAHEDHIGAVPYLWPRLRCPIYCSEFTAAVLRNKFKEAPECKDAEIHVVDTQGSMEIGAFKTHFIHVAHSIPGSFSMVLETKSGHIVHSGDWNLDPKPIIGDVTDKERFRHFGQKGVLAYIGDSTNAEVSGRAGSETEAAQGLLELFKTCNGRIAVTIFSSNIARLRAICTAAKETERSVALIGRSLLTMAGAARKSGLLDGLPEFMDLKDISQVPDDKQLLVVTGSQGEYRSALARMSRDEHRDISLKRGDTVVFSARSIPGNEVEINAVKNNLSAAGVKIIDPYDCPYTIHVSGHPCRDEIIDMYNWLKPQTVVPVHGERMQLDAQARLARECQVENVLVPENGTVIELGAVPPSVIGKVVTGLLAIEPKRILAADHQAIVGRRKLQYTGAIHVTLVMSDRGDLVADPQISLLGLVEEDTEEGENIYDTVYGEVEDILADMQREDLQDDHAVHEEVRIGVRRVVHVILGFKPKTTVHVVRV